MKFPLLLAALVACAVDAAGAQGSPVLQGAPTFDAKRLDPSVAGVVTGGQWRVATEGGSFRLVLLRGWDRPGGRIVVQWLQAQRAAKRFIVHSSRDLEGIDERWALEVPRIELRNGRWLGVISGTTDSGRIRRTWRFALGAPGELREVQAP